MGSIYNFIQKTDKLVDEIIYRDNSKSLFTFDKIDFRKAFANYLWELIFFSEYQSKFCSNQDEIGENSILMDVRKIILKHITTSNIQENNKRGKIPAILTTLLSGKQGRTMYYCKNVRQFNYLLPLLRREESPTIILTLQAVDERSIDSNNIEIIEFELISEDVINKDYLRQNFYDFYLYFNTLFILINILKPTKFILIEGCHYEEEIISSISKSLEVKTYCVQQGWPGLMHTRFKNMTYDYFLTWGDGFSNLWRKFNPIPQFNSIGYLYNTSPNIQYHNKKAITFFFQAPIFTIDIDCFNKMIEFAIFCAKTFQDRVILIREHPEYSLSKQDKIYLNKYSNLSFVTNENLENVFLQTEIGVSVFSSALMEGIFYDVIPFIFNLTSSPSYFPNLAADEVGVEVKTVEAAEEKILSIVQPGLNSILKDRVKNAKEYYFKHNTK